MHYGSRIVPELPAIELSKNPYEDCLAIINGNLLRMGHIAESPQNYLVCSGYKFELSSPVPLRSIYERFRTERATAITEWKQRQTDQRHPARIVTDPDLEKYELLAGFLEAVEQWDTSYPGSDSATKENKNKDIVKEETQPKLNGHDPLEKMFDGVDMLWWNGSMFRLSASGSSGEIFVDKKWYAKAKRIGDVKLFDAGFRQLLEADVREEAESEWKVSNEKKAIIARLEERIKRLADLTTVSNSFYNYSTIGYDWQEKLLLRYLPGFSEHYHHKRYGDSQSAVGVTLRKIGEDITYDRGIAEKGRLFVKAGRKFVPGNGICCPGCLFNTFQSDTKIHPIRRIFNYLDGIATSIETHGRIHE